jgi:hypothetical protein
MYCPCGSTGGPKGRADFNLDQEDKMRFLRWAIAAVVVLTTVPAWAYKWQISDDSYVGIDYLLQAQAQFTQDGAPNKEEFSKDLFVRRSRFVLLGGLTKYISFFMETDQVNWGKNGDWAAPFFVQDAFVTFKVIDEFQVDTGLILLPLTRHSFMGATSLDGVDYHLAMIKYPDGTTKVWRDAGVQLRGYIFDQKLQYRLGVFGGSQNVTLQKDTAGKAVVTSNSHDWPRFTGHLRYAILGTETDFFPKGIYFAKDAILSVGVGADAVPDSVLVKPAVLDPATGKVATAATIGTHIGTAGDVFLDLPFDENNELVFQGALLYYADGQGIKTGGIGVLSEVGYRWQFLEPVVQFDWFKSDGVDADYLGMRGGLNLWLLKHNASIKAEYGASKTGNLASAPFIQQVTAQVQLYF